MSAFDWHGFLTLAIKLSQEADEALSRSAISRAYYFVYNTAFPPTRRKPVQIL